VNGRGWGILFVESARLALRSIRAQPLRSTLAVAGVVVGVVTVTLVTSLLAGARNQVALLFREFGSDNAFVYHRRGDPYTPPSQSEANRVPLDPAFAAPLVRLGENIRDVAAMRIVPKVAGGAPLIARAGSVESDTVLVEGVSANFVELAGADLEEGRPFTELEDRTAARVAILGSNVARALFGRGPAVGRTLTLAGTSFVVVGEMAPRKGGFFGVNRQDNVISLPLGTVRRLYPDAKETVLYVRAEPGRRDLALIETEEILRRLRHLEPGEESDFHISTAEQIIRQFDRISALIGAVTVLLAAVSLAIGGLGVASVSIISVTERTREIGLRRAIGARRREVLRQFLLEAALLSLAGGLLGVLIAAGLGALVTLASPGLAALPPAWAVVGGVLASAATGVLAGIGPARHAARLDPVEALRYE